MPSLFALYPLIRCATAVPRVLAAQRPRWLDVLGVATAVLLVIWLVGPELDALRNAAGGGGNGGGFSRFVAFINRLADYLIPVGAAFGVLGVWWGGALLIRGDARAGGVLGGVALGLAVVLLAKPIAA
jgi:hypothetical protein